LSEWSRSNRFATEKMQCGAVSYAGFDLNGHGEGISAAFVDQFVPAALRIQASIIPLHNNVGYLSDMHWFTHQAESGQQNLFGDSKSGASKFLNFKKASCVQHA